MAIIVGEYPYYRANISNWGPDLSRLYAEGVDVISFYIPWRLHECAEGEFDFSGRRVANADLYTFLRMIRAEGLKAIVKPGPFIHAEVRYGGLPDRVAHLPMDIEGPRSANFGIGFGDDPPPSPNDPQFLREAISWLEIVQERIIAPNVDIITAVQVGNEGVFSDAAKPADHPRRYYDSPIRVALSRFNDVFSYAPVKRYVNLPLPDPSIADHLAYDWWVTQVLPMAKLTDTAGYTAWAGPPSVSDSALARTLVSGHQFSMGCVEENWGHVWTSSLYRSSDVLLHHSVLSLALGSSTLSIYTACSTDDMDDSLEPSCTDLIAEGMDPRVFAGPYCPAAPINPGGHEGESIIGLRRLAALRSAIDVIGEEWVVDYDVDIFIDPAVAFVTWKVADVVKDLILRHKVHARVVFEISEKEIIERPTVRILKSSASGASDALQVEFRKNGIESSWRPLQEAELSADTLYSALKIPKNIPLLESSSIYRVRWLAQDGSGARLDFIFNRSGGKANIRYGLRGTCDNLRSDYPFTLNPYGVLVVSSRNGVSWEEVSDIR